VGTNETFCTECQRVTYVAEGSALECPVCSSPLLATIENGAAKGASAGDPEELSAAG
jgi:hypothetical protein